MAKLRVGLVGAGFAANFHMHSLRGVRAADIEVTAVASRRAESCAAFAQKWGLRPCAGLREMLPHVDVLDVVSPPAAHDEAIAAATAAGKHLIVEKPFSGYFGPEGCGDEYRGCDDGKEAMLERVTEKLRRLAAAIRGGGAGFGYAENFVYAPSVQKEREIVEKTGAQLLRMIGEESHNGSGSPVYGVWRHQGGGSLMGKGCHPLTALLYLKRVEGLARDGKPIRPRSITCRCESLTRLPGYADRGFLRTKYHDTEDHVWGHITFADGTVGDIISGEVVLGGIYNYIEVFANNHRTRCNLSPTPLLETFNPRGEQFADVYTVEKISTKEGWTALAPDENYTLGYYAELDDFLKSFAERTEPQCGLDLALDTISAIYAGYLSDERRGREVEVPLL